MVTFDGKGLTLTNASFMCNKAKDKKTEAEEFLKSLSFVDTKMSVIGTDVKNVSAVGITDISKINEALEVIAEMNGFIAYFAEGRKAVETYKDNALSYSPDEYFKDNEIELPTLPQKKTVKLSTLDDVIADMSIGDRQKYLALEALASAYGVHLHNDGSIASARKIAHKKVSKPIETKDNGRDTLFYYNSASIDLDIVDAEFERLNDLYREAERKLNKMKSDLKETLRIKNAEETVLQSKYNDEYSRALAEYNLKMDTIKAKFRQHMKDVEAQVSKAKIEIPKAYEGLIEEWSSKKSE